MPRRRSLTARLAGLSRPALALLAFWALVAIAACGAATWVAVHRAPTAGSAPQAQAGIAPPAAPPPAVRQPAATPAPAAPPRPIPVLAPATNPHHWPQVGLVVSGLGLSRDISEQAIQSLPAGVTLAFSPDAATPQPLVDEARARGHEVLLSLPMEPEGSPRNDEGDHQLSLGQTEAANRDRLDWVLARFGGYDGVTNAEAGQYGGHFADSAGFDAVAGILDGRSLLYLATIPPLTPPARTLQADLVVDDPPNPVDIDARLIRIEALAEARGCAIGAAGPLSPMLVERLRVWTNALPARGILLLPVGAMTAGGGAPCPAPGSPPPIAEPVPSAPPAPRMSPQIDPQTAPQTAPQTPPTPGNPNG